MDYCLEEMKSWISTKVMHTGNHNSDNSKEFAIQLNLHWTYAYVYPLTVNSIKRKINRMHQEHQYLCQVSTRKKYTEIIM